MLKQNIISLNGKRLVTESVIVSFTEYLMLGSLFLINVLLNRYYNTSTLGDFSFSYSVAQIAIMGLGGAMSPILRREILEQKQSSAVIVCNVLQIRAFFSVLFVLVALLASFILINRFGHIVYFVLAMLLAKGFDLLNDTFYTTFQSIHRFKYYAILKSCNAICNILAVCVVALYKRPIEYVYLSIILVSMFFFIVNFYYLNRLIMIIKQVFKDFAFNATKRYYLKESWPLVVNSIFFQLSSRLSVIFVYSISGKQISGVFSAAIMIITVFTAFANAIAIVLFSHLSNLYRENTNQFYKFLNKQSIRLFCFGIILYAIFYVTLPLQFLFLGQMPLYASRIFSFSAIAIPFAIVSAILGNVFVIVRRQKMGMYVSFIVLLINCLIYYVLPFVSKIDGPAFAFVLSNIFIVIIFVYFIYQIKKQEQVCFLRGEQKIFVNV
jgi:O-antigen/teichoic acid export membrane protein